MAQTVGFKFDAVESRLRELEKTREKLFRELGQCDLEVHKLSLLTEEERSEYLDLDINHYSDIPTRIKTYIYNYGKEHYWPMPITARFVFNKGKKAIYSIPGIGYWSMKDLDDFFLNKGLSWK